jgi:hypothetical protein
MAWIDGLDIPLQYVTEAQFFEFGRDEISEAERITPARSRPERLWGHPGLRPVGPLVGIVWPRRGHGLLPVRVDVWPGSPVSRIAVLSEQQEFEVRVRRNGRSPWR